MGDGVKRVYIMRGVNVIKTALGHFPFLLWFGRV